MGHTKHFDSDTPTEQFKPINADSLEFDMLELELLRVMMTYSSVMAITPLTAAQKSTHLKLLQGMFRLSQYTMEERAVIVKLLEMLEFQSNSLHTTIKLLRQPG